MKIRLFIFLLFMVLKSEAKIPTLYRQVTDSVLHLMMESKFYNSINLIEKIIRKDPYGTYPLFLKANFYTFLNDYYYTDKYLEKIDSIYKKINHLYPDPSLNKSWNYLIKASEYSHLSLKAKNEEENWQALKMARKGGALLEEILQKNPSFIEASFLFNTYNFFKSSTLGFLFDNTKKKSLHKIKESLIPKNFYYFFGWATYASCLYRDKNYNKISNEIKTHLPTRYAKNPYYLIITARSDRNLGQYQKALKAFYSMMTKFNEDTFYRSPVAILRINYNIIVCLSNMDQNEKLQKYINLFIKEYPNLSKKNQKKMLARYKKILSISQKNK